jgi:two-component system response regulator
MLIVEDDPAWRSLYLMEFGSQFEVYEANDGLQALAMLEWVQPDVILLDLRLPRMDGYKFLRQLELKGVRAPVVVCTGGIVEDDRAMAGVSIAQKSADLRYVRGAVRAAVHGPWGRSAEESPRSDDTEWLD